MTRAAVELGVKFRADRAGTATGVRFYKAAANTGTHTGSLWSADRHASRDGHVHQRDRDRLADGDVRHAGPAHGRHDLRRLVLRAQRPLLGDVRPALETAFDNAPLHALAGATNDNGVYAYGTGQTFPTNSYQLRQLLGRRHVRRRPGARRADRR